MPTTKGLCSLDRPRHVDSDRGSGHQCQTMRTRKNQMSWARPPWFGPRPYGGYRPQTWQGAIVATAVVLVSVVASNKGRVPWEVLLVLPVVAIPVFVRRRQGQRR